MVIWDHFPENRSEKMALCIGKFDGFHKGHRLLIEEAKETGCPVGVLTFLFSHTETIDSVEEKRNLAEKLGVDIYMEIKAGPAIFSLTPEAFIRDVVSEKLHAAHVIVGEDSVSGETVPVIFRHWPLMQKVVIINCIRSESFVTEPERSAAVGFASRYLTERWRMSHGCWGVRIR